MMIRATALAVGMAALATSVVAETAFEMTFRPGTLNSFEIGDGLLYDSVVTETGEDATTTIEVQLTEDGLAALEQQGAEGQERTLGRFDASVGNPVAMYFLERTIRTVAEATGGSDFYLRNRIKDALREPEEVRTIEIDWQGEPVEATEIILTPFEKDPNRPRLGPYGDLRIRLVMGEGVPGWYHTLRANAGDYRSELSLADVQE